MEIIFFQYSDKRANKNEEVCMNINHELFPYHRQIDSMMRQLNQLKKYSDYEIEKHNDKVIAKFYEAIEKSSGNKKLPSLPGYIYVIKQDKYYKIGKSRGKKGLKKRYATENPNPLEVLICKKVSDYSEIEKKIHKKFEKKRFRGEWFLLDGDDVQEIKDILK